jgi:TonB family protein
MYYLKNPQGQVVRALEFPGHLLHFILRHDTGRVETFEDLTALENIGIEFTLIKTVDKDTLTNESEIAVDSHLRLVREGGPIQKNVELPKDEEKKFVLLLKQTSLAGGALAAILAGLAFFLDKPQDQKEELQVVQVMDRQQIQKMMTVPPRAERPRPTVQQKRYVVKRTISPRPRRNMAPSQNSGVLGVLGSLQKSNQRGGLNLNQADTSSGIGRGGRLGSGGAQTSIYSKGLTSAPLGVGGNVNGAGGYGTKGKGGGRAGYGQVSLIGAGNAYFQPVDSEAFVEGGLDRNEIAAVIQRHLSEVRYCYEQGLVRKPNLSGRVSMKFLIGPKGSVTLAQVQNSSLGHAPVENCIRDRLRTWNFPQPEGGVTVKVTYPFILRRVSDS